MQTNEGIVKRIPLSNMAEKTTLRALSNKESLTSTSIISKARSGVTSSAVSPLPHFYVRAMENNRNIDGLDGLPLDMWMGLQEQAQPQYTNVARPVYQASGLPQSSDSYMERDVLNQRNIPPSSLGNEVEHINFQHQQHIQRMPAFLHAQFVQSSQNRSLWPQLLSAETSVTSSKSLSTHVPFDSNLQDPFVTGLIKSGTDFSNTSTKVTEGLLMPNRPASSSLLISQDRLPQEPFQGLSHDKVSRHLNQLMNLSKSETTPPKVSLSKPLSVSTELLSLESSGDYSPVSPPANPLTYGDSLLDLANQDKSFGFPSREPSTGILSMTNPPLQDLSRRMSFPADSLSNLAAYAPQAPAQGKPFSFSRQKSLASPLDMPLDMTTAVVGKSDLSHVGIEKQTENLVTSVSPYEKDKTIVENLDFNYQSNDHSIDPQLSSSIVCDGTTALPLSQLPLKMSVLNNGSLFPLQTPASISVSVSTTTSLLQEKCTKIPKSTPKKSNFYGRDVSLFSLLDATTATTSATTTVLVSAPSIRPNFGVGHLCESKISKEVENGESKDNHLPCTMQGEKSTKASGITIENQETAGPFPSTSPCLKKTCLTQISIPSDISAKSCTIRKGVSDNNFNPEELQHLVEQLDSHVPSPDMSREKTGSLQNVEHPQENDMDSDLVKFENIPKGLKGRKRKSSGFGKRNNKQNVKKAKIKPRLRAVPVMPQSMIAVERAIVRHDSFAENVTNKSEVTNDTTNFTATTKKGGVKKTSKIAKNDEEENPPRRSSSRKSKDNAMRLIELQADAGFVGILGVDEEESNKRISRKRSVVNSALKTFEDEPPLSDLSDDSSLSDYHNKDKDDDYVIDEEEAAAVEMDEVAGEDKLNSKVLTSKKKTGSLRISFKLSGDSSAEIVSGIEDLPVRKKRKATKKNSLTKNLEAKPNLNENLLLSKDLPPGTSNIEQANVKPISDTNYDVQTSLMEKYFSSASASKQNLGKKSKKMLSKNVGQKFNKNLVGKKKNLNQTKDHNLLESKNSGPISSKRQRMDIAQDNLPKFRCGYCSQRYHTKLDLLTHMDGHMSEMERKDSSKGSDELMNPIQSKEKSSVQNNSINNKQEHTLLKQKGPSKDKNSLSEVQKNQCGECEKLFKSKSLLLNHIRCHTTDKPFVCDICHKCFADQILLSSHHKIHEQENLLRCKLCSKAFINKTDLIHHMQSHPKRTGSKSVCTKTPKKVGSKKSSGIPSQVTKKTSFASALSGDLGDSNANSDISSVLVLKRKETPTSKTKPESRDKISSCAQKTICVKANAQVDQNECKRVEEMINEKVNQKTATDQIVEKSVFETDNSSGVCTCKECPECVTRFLQTFV